MDILKSFLSFLKNFLEYPPKVQLGWFITIFVVMGWVWYLSIWTKEAIKQNDNLLNQVNSESDLKTDTRLNSKSKQPKRSKENILPKPKQSAEEIMVDIPLVEGEDPDKDILRTVYPNLSSVGSQVNFRAVVDLFSISDSDRRPLKNLTNKDFSIIERYASKEIQVNDFKIQPLKLPIRIIIMIDSSGSMSGKTSIQRNGSFLSKIEVVKEAAISFIEVLADNACKEGRELTA